MSEDIFVPLMWAKIRRFGAKVFRRLKHPISYVIAGCLVLLVLADQFFPKRMANVAINIADEVFLAGTFIGDWYITPPWQLRREILIRSYNYAARRGLPVAQVKAVDILQTFNLDKADTALVQAFLYGAYMQGYSPSAEMLWARVKHLSQTVTLPAIISAVEEATPNAKCNGYKTYISDIVSGRSDRALDCLKQNRAAPMSHQRWRRFLACAESKVGRWRVYDLGANLVAACDPASNGRARGG